MEYLEKALYFLLTMELRDLVDQLRMASEGRPIGIKLAAGHVERDLAVCVFAGADFVTIDGRGGATGASPRLVRDSTSLPTIYALRRARKYLDSVGASLDLVITGGRWLCRASSRAHNFRPRETHIASGQRSSRSRHWVRVSPSR